MKKVTNTEILTQEEMHEELSGKGQRRRAILKASQCKEIDKGKICVRLSTYYKTPTTLDCYLMINPLLTFKEVQERLAHLSLVIKFNLQAL